LIAVINLGNSNLQSVINALNSLEADYFVTDKSEELFKCDKIILPGVGSFSSGINRLKELKLFDFLKNEILVENKPFLGICLGMQMLFDSSEEDNHESKGLGLISGKIVQLPKSEKYKIPRIGWGQSNVNFDFLGLSKGELIDFYYIHSFYAKPKDSGIISIHSDNEIASAIKLKNIYGCQFHPEKSHKSGLKILNTFVSL